MTLAVKVGSPISQFSEAPSAVSLHSFSRRLYLSGGFLTEQEVHVGVFQ